MGIFRYFLGYIYVVEHPQKGYWNSKRKKYVSTFRGATFYKNKACAKKTAKKLGRTVRYHSFIIEAPEWW